MEKIFCVDGNFYLHRVFSTLRTNRAIEEALSYAFIGLIMRDACAIKATRILVAFDGPKVFRYKLYPLYKANRKKESEGVEIADGEGGKEIYSYLPYVRNFLTTAGLVWTQLEEYEADDVLASAATHYAGNVVLGAIDKDGYQSLKANVKAYNSIVEPPKYITMEQAEKSKGVKTEHMVMYQTLIGDKIDNIPSLKPPQAAKKIINKWGSFKTWFANADKDEKIWLRSHQVQLTLNKQLVEMRTDLALPEVTELKVPKLERKNMPKSWYAYQDWLYPKSKGLFKR